MTDSYRIVTLTVRLAGVEPIVERVIEVADDVTLDLLHSVLQQAMGWTNAHLFEFQVGEDCFGIGMQDWDYGPRLRPARAVQLREIIDAGHIGFDYIYDLGDHWRHSVQIDSLRLARPDEIVPRLVSCAGRCPPEDVGGAEGFAHFLAAIGDPTHPEHAETLAWHRRPFDAADPDVAKLRHGLSLLAKRWTRQKARWRSPRLWSARAA